MKQPETSERSMIMNGQTTKYENYLKNLSKMEEPIVPKAILDMRGALQLARSKGVTIGNLSKEERDRFIRYI